MALFRIALLRMALLRIALSRIALFRMALFRMALLRIAFWVGALALAAEAAGTAKPTAARAAVATTAAALTRIRDIWTPKEVGGAGCAIRISDPRWTGIVITDYFRSRVSEISPFIGRNPTWFFCPITADS